MVLQPVSKTKNILYCRRKTGTVDAKQRTSAISVVPESVMAITISFQLQINQESSKQQFFPIQQKSARRTGKNWENASQRHQRKKEHDKVE